MDIDVQTRFDERDWERDDVDGSLRFPAVGLGWFGRDIAIPAIEAAEHCETTAVARERRRPEGRARPGADGGRAT